MTEAHAVYSAWEQGESALAGAMLDIGAGLDAIPDVIPEAIPEAIPDALQAECAAAEEACGSGSGAACRESDPASRFEAENRARADRDRVILEELPQVRFIAARLLERLPPGVQLEDLVQAGVLGLMEAYANYDHARNAQFRTYARFRVRGAILDSLRSLDWGSRGARRRAREIAEAAKRLEATLGRAPEREEIATALGMSLELLEAARNEIDGLQIVQQQAAAGDGEQMVDLVEAARSAWDSPFELYAKAEEKRVLAEAIERLTEREQTVLSLYYREELTMKEVSEVVGIAVSRVSQLHAAALAKLRRALDQDSLPGALDRSAAR